MVLQKYITLLIYHIFLTNSDLIKPVYDVNIVLNNLHFVNP